MERMAQAVRDAGAIPAIVLVLRGSLFVGASVDQVEQATRDPRLRKASVRDIGYVVATGASAGLTVSATLCAADLVGIRVFATGGIGGVHPDSSETGDMSADLEELSRNPVIVVCAGAKSVLDIRRTLERLESLGVPVFGFQSDYFPAFFVHSSGFLTPRLDSARDVALAARLQWELAPRTGIVLANPLSEMEAIAPQTWANWMDAAALQARKAGVRGQDVTPYLLSEIAEISRGDSVRANVALLLSNAKLGAQIACELTQ
jgi:pseudouridine-5'-phosphate glycosidase